MTETVEAIRYFLQLPLQVAAGALGRSLLLEKTVDLVAAAGLPEILFLGKDMPVETKVAVRRLALVAEVAVQDRLVTVRVSKHLISFPVGTAAELGFVAQ
jgi:hypothetical protein